MNRRQFMKLGLGASITGTAASYGLIALPISIGHQSTNTLYSAYDNEQGLHFISRLSHDFGLLGNTQFDSIQIPFRAHDTLPLSDHRSLSFGRRPNNQMVICDFNTSGQQVIIANQGRHFYGHGCLQESSNAVFTTENAFSLKNHKTSGVIGIRDLKSFQHIGEFESFGVGPHDIKLLPDGKTLVVANGGIQTHPEFGRRKLNLKTMQSNVVFIDIASGKKVDEYRLPNHQLSIRHLSITDDGEIAIATQYQGKIPANTPDFLLAYISKKGLQTFNESQHFTLSCDGYIGDVAIDSENQILAATSSRGNNLSLWDIRQSRLLKVIPIPGCCGIYFDQNNSQFLISNDQGAVFQIASQESTDLTKCSATQLFATKLWDFPVKWDNHMTLFT